MLQTDAKEEGGYGSDNYQKFIEVTRTVLALQRAALLKLRNEDQINDEVLRRLETELDLIESRNRSLES